MIDLENATNYFKTRTVWGDWSEYSAEQQTAAIEQAKRDLSRALGRPMKEDEPPYKAGDRTRDEFACYEQAFYTLQKETLPRKKNGAIVPPVNPTDESYPDWKEKNCGAGYGKFSRDALVWLSSKIITEIQM